MAVDGALEREHQVVFCDSEPSADYYKFRVEDIDQSCYCLPENRADLFDAFDRERVLVHQCLNDVVNADVFRLAILGR